MAWVPAVMEGIGMAMDANSASNANRTNIMLAREQMKFQERMSSTAVSRRVMDLQRSGLNPMLAYSDAASSPAGSQGHVESVTGGKAGDRMANAGVSVAQMQNLKAQTAATIAQGSASTASARKANAEAEVVEASIPYSGQAANLKVQELSENVRHVAALVENLMQQTESSRYDLENMKPVQVLGEKIANQAASLGLSAARTKAFVAEELKRAGVPMTEGLRNFIDFVGDKVSRGVMHVEDVASAGSSAVGRGVERFKKPLKRYDWKELK